MSTLGNVLGGIARGIFQPLNVQAQPAQVGPTDIQKVQNPRLLAPQGGNPPGAELGAFKPLIGGFYIDKNLRDNTYSCTCSVTEASGMGYAPPPQQPVQQPVQQQIIAQPGLIDTGYYGIQPAQIAYTRDKITRPPGLGGEYFQYATDITGKRVLVPVRSSEEVTRPEVPRPFVDKGRFDVERPLLRGEREGLRIPAPGLKDEKRRLAGVPETIPTPALPERRRLGEKAPEPDRFERKTLFDNLVPNPSRGSSGDRGALGDRGRTLPDSTRGILRRTGTSSVGTDSGAFDNFARTKKAQVKALSSYLESDNIEDILSVIWNILPKEKRDEFI